MKMLKVFLNILANDRQPMQIGSYNTIHQFTTYWMLKRVDVANASQTQNHQQVPRRSMLGACWEFPINSGWKGIRWEGIIVSGVRDYLIPKSNEHINFIEQKSVILFCHIQQVSAVNTNKKIVLVLIKLYILFWIACKSGLVLPLKWHVITHSILISTLKWKL